MIITRKLRRAAGRNMVADSLSGTASTVESTSGFTRLRRCASRTIHQPEMPATKVAAVRNAPDTAWGTAANAVLLVSNCQMLTSSARPRSALYTAPTGCCMNELAAMMKNAERLTPIATSQMHPRCTSRGSRPQPKIHRPRNVDSMKNAARASIASGAPNTSPTKREYSLQFIPNWNSCTMPVATPSAKLMRKSLPKNFVSRYQASFFGHHPHRLHDRDDRRESDRERNEDEVVDGRDAELPTGEVQRVHDTPCELVE